MYTAEQHNDFMKDLFDSMDEKLYATFMTPEVRLNNFYACLNALMSTGFGGWR